MTVIDCSWWRSSETRGVFAPSACAATSEPEFTPLTRVSTEGEQLVSEVATPAEQFDHRRGFVSTDQLTRRMATDALPNRKEVVSGMREGSARQGASILVDRFTSYCQYSVTQATSSSPDGPLEATGVYTFRDRETVRDFLRSHPQLNDILMEAQRPLRHRFGPSVKVTLDVIDDPDMSGHRQMFGVILTSLSIDEAFDRLQALRREWLVYQLDRARDLFNFTLAFE